MRMVVRFLRSLTPTVAVAICRPSRMVHRPVTLISSLEGDSSPCTALRMAARTSSFVVTSSRSEISTSAVCQSLVTIDPGIPLASLPRMSEMAAVALSPFVSSTRRSPLTVFLIDVTCVPIASKFISVALTARRVSAYDRPSETLTSTAAGRWWNFLAGCVLGTFGFLAGFCTSVNGSSTFSVDLVSVCFVGATVLIGVPGAGVLLVGVLESFLSVFFLFLRRPAVGRLFSSCLREAGDG